MLSKPISSIAKRVSSGLTPLRSNPEFWLAGTIPWLKTEQLGEKFIYSTTEKISEAALRKTSIKVYPPNTLSIAMYGDGKTRGNVSIIKSEMATNQACCNIELDPELADFEYVYYFLKTQYNELRNLSSGVRKNLNSDDIKNFVIRLPKELTDQKKIAAALSALDAKIDCNNRLNAELKAMAKTLYDYWFVQFDFPDANGKPYKSSGGKMVYNATLKREIPAGWEDSLIGDVLGKVPTTTKILNKDILETGSIPVIDQGQSYICGFTNEQSSLIVPKQPHVVFGDHTRAVKLVNFNYARGADGTQILLSESQRMPGYLMYQVVSDIDLSSYGYARHFKFLKESRIVLPERSVAQRYQDVVTPWFEKIKQSVFENQELSRLRDWLLPMLMNGQVTVA